MKYKFLEQEFKYDGTQLQSLFAYMNHKVQGDSMVAWVGECDIPFAHMVDGEDVLAQSPIRGSHMLHFIIEEFGANLELAVTRQRLFAAIVMEELRLQRPEGEAAGALNPGRRWRREGDDIYWGNGKLSISIATVSPVSALIHFAINVSNEGTPVETASLEDLNLEPHFFADCIASRFVEEIKTINEATCKVRWVR